MKSWKNYLYGIEIFEGIVLLWILYLSYSLSTVHGGLDSLGNALALAFMYKGSIFLNTIIVFVSLLPRRIKVICEG